MRAHVKYVLNSYILAAQLCIDSSRNKHQLHTPTGNVMDSIHFWHFSSVFRVREEIKILLQFRRGLLEDALHFWLCSTFAPAVPRPRAPSALAQPHHIWGRGPELCGSGTGFGTHLLSLRSDLNDQRALMYLEGWVCNWESLQGNYLSNCVTSNLTQTVLDSPCVQAGFSPPCLLWAGVNSPR